jgi:hypothetical protein
MYVDMIGESITINQVENNSSLKGDVLPEMMMTLKLEVKLGQLFVKNPQLMKTMENFLMKMKTNQVTDVCKVNIVKAKDFDEAIPIVQVRVGKFEVRNVLLDGGSSVNIILENLRKKFKLRKLQSTSFVVCMVDQWKVQPMGLIQTLNIDMASCVYKIVVFVLKMENGVAIYFMFLQRS